MSRKAGRTVVVGVDFDICGDDAILEGLKMLAAGLAAELHAVNVLDPSDVIDHPAMPALMTEENVLERAPQVLRDRVTEVARDASIELPQAALKVHARIGKPADALLQVAVDYDADMIIVGTHARRGLDRLVLGSVAERLVRSASCPVLVARPKDHSGRPKSERPDPPYRAGEEPAFADPVDRPVHISTDVGREVPTGIRIV